jgi:hypothetical protein
MLPSSREVTATNSGWQKYADAEATFGRIVPGKTTAAELKALNLDPSTNPSVARLQTWQVRERFIPNKLVTLDDLDTGVRTCVEAGPACTAYEVNYVSTQSKRIGNAALDVIKVHRETQTAGWRFNGLILMKDGVVVYTLTAGQPRIQQLTENSDPLGPLQALASKLNLDNVASLKNSVSGGGSSTSSPSPDSPAMGIAVLKK